MRCARGLGAWAYAEVRQVMRRPCADSKTNTHSKDNTGHQEGGRAKVRTIPLSILDKDESTVQSAHLRGRVQV